MWLRAGVAVVTLDASIAVRRVSARVGDNLEIKCEVSGTPTPHIIWRRNGLDLAALNSEVTLQGSHAKHYTNLCVN